MIRKKDIIKDIEDLIFFTKFVVYDKNKKDTKKMKKKLKKLKTLIEDGEYDECCIEDWCDKIYEED